MMTKETNLQRLEDEAALAGMEQAGTQLSDKGEFAAKETFAVKQKPLPVKSKDIRIKGVCSFYANTSTTTNLRVVV